MDPIENETTNEPATPASALTTEASSTLIDEASGAPAAADPAAKQYGFRLTLDVDGVYWGAMEIALDDAKEGDVVLDHIPDNPPGKYRWNRDTGALEILPVSLQKETSTAPSLEQAFAALIDHVEKIGSAELHAVVAAWRKWYASTVDSLKKSD